MSEAPESELAMLPIATKAQVEQHPATTTTTTTTSSATAEGKRARPSEEPVTTTQPEQKKAKVLVSHLTHSLAPTLKTLYKFV